MSKEELLNIADYIIERTALRASELLYEKLQGENKWISQSEAWKRHGGRAFVTNLHRTGKVATRKVNNQIQYYQPELAKHSECKSELITFIINRVAILTKEAYNDFEYHCFYKQK